jgi:hypothetical protein
MLYKAQLMLNILLAVAANAGIGPWVSGEGDYDI